MLTKQRLKQVYQKIKPAGIAAFLVFWATFIPYLFTLAPTYTWSHFGFDAGDLITAIRYWGIAHPPGFPIYIFIGKAFSLLPIGDLAYRLNLMSAFFGSLTCVMVFLAVHRLTKGILAATTASLLLAFSVTFWGQSLITEVYTLAAFFSSLLLFVNILVIEALEKEDYKKADALFFLLLAVFGLSLANHLTTIFFGPAIIGLFVIRCKKMPFTRILQLSLKNAASFILGLAPYLYIYFRAKASPLFNWGDPSTPLRFFNYLTGKEFQHFIQLPKSGLDALSYFFILLNKNITLVGIILALVGLVLLYKEKKMVCLTSLASVVSLIIFNLSYTIDNIETFYLPAYVIFTFWAGYGLQRLFLLLKEYISEDPLFRASLPIFEFTRIHIGFLKKEKLRITLGDLLFAGMTVSVFCLPVYLVGHNLSAVNLRNDYSAKNFAYSAFQAMDQAVGRDQKKVIIPEEAETTFALRYYRYVDFIDREDVTFFLTNGVYDSNDNLAFFREKYPFLIFPDHPTGVDIKSNSRGLLTCIKANWDKYSFFYAKGLPFPQWGLEQQIELEGEVMFSSVGPIYRVHPKGPFD